MALNPFCAETLQINDYKNIVLTDLEEEKNNSPNALNYFTPHETTNCQGQQSAAKLLENKFVVKQNQGRVL